ncbi:hypothetical protein DENSPDRAFT_584289 [Dentipellis sp. KUC8613]|nr:hypothetical protein DENSPDRAFT_584289 [Dentipellis sp. KUC8613]
MLASQHTGTHTRRRARAPRPRRTSTRRVRQTPEAGTRTHLHHYYPPSLPPLRLAIQYTRDPAPVPVPSPCPPARIASIASTPHAHNAPRQASTSWPAPPHRHERPGRLPHLPHRAAGVAEEDEQIRSSSRAFRAAAMHRRPLTGPRGAPGCARTMDVGFGCGVQRQTAARVHS